MQAPHSHLIKADKAEAWYEKPLHGAWHKGVSKVIDMTRIYQCLNKRNIRANTDSLIMAAQKQTFNTRAVAHKISQHCARSQMKVVQETCRDRGTKYTEKHNSVTSIVCRPICAECNLEHSKNWGVKLEGIVKNNYTKILCNIPI